jgi:hypothetical protein
MTQFTKENIIIDGAMVYYGEHGYSTPWVDRKFVARFKYSGGGITKAKFLKTLKKNYTVEDYMSKMAAGAAPLKVLMDDGLLVFDNANKKFILEGKVL